MDALRKRKVAIEGSSGSASVSAFIEYHIIRDVKCNSNVGSDMLCLFVQPQSIKYVSLLHVLCY